MARVRFSGLVVDIRGSIGSTTLQKNAYGYTIKNKPNVIRPNTSFQDFTKRNFLQTIQAWQSLSQIQQSQWNSFAETTKQFSKNNISAQLSGYALFTKYNMAVLQGGHDIIYVPGSGALLMPLFTPIVTATMGGLTLNLNPVTDLSDLLANVYMSTPISKSKNYVGTLPRYIDTLPLRNSATSIYDKYLNRLGQTVLTGNIVFMSLVIFSTLSAIVYAKRNYKITIV